MNRTGVYIPSSLKYANQYLLRQATGIPDAVVVTRHPQGLDVAAFKAALLEVAKQSGFTQETFDKCLSDDKLLQNIAAGHSRANEAFSITRIPTVFVNGKKLVGEPTLATVEKMLEAVLPKS